MGERQNAYRVLVGKPEEKENLQDLVVDGSIILNLAINIYCGRVWTGFMLLGT
jgi:hypothetical protein